MSYCRRKRSNRSTDHFSSLTLSFSRRDRSSSSVCVLDERCRRVQTTIYNDNNIILEPPILELHPPGSHSDRDRAANIGTSTRSSVRCTVLRAHIRPLSFPSRLEPKIAQIAPKTGAMCLRHQPTRMCTVMACIHFIRHRFKRSSSLKSASHCVHSLHKARSHASDDSN